MRINVIILFTLFLANHALIAQEREYVQEELQLGTYVGIGRLTDQSTTPDRVGIGAEYGISFTRKNPKRPFQIEVDFSSTYGYLSSDYFSYITDNNKDTVYRNFRRSQFVDIAVKSNILFVDRSNFDFALVYGAIVGRTIKMKSTTNSYFESTHDLIEKGESSNIAMDNFFNIGLQIGLLFTYKLSNHLLLTAEPLLIGKVGAGIFESDGPFTFQQLRISARWIFI